MTLSADLQVLLANDADAFASSVSVDGVKFEFALNRQASNCRLIVFFPGAHELRQSKPKFQRRGHFAALDCQCLSLFDPTLYLQADLSIGWFQGELGGIPHFSRAGDLIEGVADTLGVSAADIVLFGTSAGGIPAVKVSERFPECSVFIGNPQTDVLRFYRPTVDRLLEALGVGEPLDEARRASFSIVNTTSRAQIVYAQNIRDVFHLKGHLAPFRVGQPSAQYIYYDHPSGHNPMPAETELAVIRALLAGTDPAAPYSEFAVADPFKSSDAPST